MTAPARTARMGKIVNLGSQCIDRVYRVEKIVRAGETLASNSFGIFPGGKGLNQSLAAARAGASVLHVGAVGADGAWLKALMLKEGIDCTGVIELADEPTGHAVIQLNERGENAIVISGGANRRLSRAQQLAAIECAGAQDWLLLQNEINDLDFVLQEAARRSVRICLNLAPFDNCALDYPLGQVALLIVNIHEAMGLTRAKNLEEAKTNLRRLCSGALVITQGAAGLWHSASVDLGWQHLPSFAIEAVDETGAGDTFVGYLLAALVKGEDWLTALREASAAGALACTRLGAATSIPMIGEVREMQSNGVVVR